MANWRLTMINWVFDDHESLRTMSNCPHSKINANLSFDSGRFPTPNFFWYWRHAAHVSPWANITFNAASIANRPNRYAYNIGTWLAPDWWAGLEDNTHGFKNLFELVPAEVMADVRSNKAIIVIDNLNEGFSDSRLWPFWQKSCQLFGLPHKNIVYLTSNLLEPSNYKNWCNANGENAQINVLAFPHLAYEQVRCFRFTYERPTWDQHVLAKNNSEKIKVFNCLNRVNRQHRAYLLLRLLQENLEKHGLISHDRFKPDDWPHPGIQNSTLRKCKELLPLVADDADFNNNKAMHFNNELYLNSLVSLVTETNANDQNGVLFLSEKIWKPIFGLHPFMILGNKGSLAALKSMGFETFDALIDQTYDNDSFYVRIDKLITNLQTLIDRNDKMQWFLQMRELLEHNQLRFLNLDFFKSSTYKDISAIYETLST